MCEWDGFFWRTMAKDVPVGQRKQKMSENVLSMDGEYLRF